MTDKKNRFVDFDYCMFYCRGRTGLETDFAGLSAAAIILSILITFFRCADVCCNRDCTDIRRLGKRCFGLYLRKK